MKTTDQPVPEVSDEDVRRVALREFGAENLSRVLEVLEEYGKQKWNEPSPRVRLAILKMADRDFARLKQALQVAIDDYRDALPCFRRCMRSLRRSTTLDE